MRDLTKMVEGILKVYPKARNSDNWLTIKLWCEYYPSYIDRSGDRAKIALDDILLLPTEDNCKRIRAVIQNQKGLYLPTSWKVAKQRRINKQEWRNYINLNSNQ